MLGAVVGERRAMTVGSARAASHADVPTKRLPDGNCRIVARFASPSLTGQIALQLFLR